MKMYDWWWGGGVGGVGGALLPTSLAAKEWFENLAMITLFKVVATFFFFSILRYYFIHLKSDENIISDDIFTTHS